MSLPIWQATIVNEFGDIIPSATITVKDEATGLGLTVYSDRNGTTPIGTNGVFTAGVDGFAQFFAPAGNYSINAKQPINGFEKTFDFVVLTGTAATKNTGTGAGDVPLNSDLPTFGTAAAADTGLLTGNVPTADELNMVGETVNYTGANYQPTTINGIGVPQLMKNNSGGSVASGTTVAGTSLLHFYVNGSGALLDLGIASNGTWKLISPFSNANGLGAMYVKISD